MEGRQDTYLESFLGVTIVPTGELEGRQDADAEKHAYDSIVPTGELEGRQDNGSGITGATVIVPTGELEGRQDMHEDADVFGKLYQLGNWKAGKTASAAWKRAW